MILKQPPPLPGLSLLHYFQELHSWKSSDGLMDKAEECIFILSPTDQLFFEVHCTYLHPPALLCLRPVTGIVLPSQIFAQYLMFLWEDRIGRYLNPPSVCKRRKNKSCKCRLWRMLMHIHASNVCYRSNQQSFFFQITAHMFCCEGFQAIFLSVV